MNWLDFDSETDAVQLTSFNLYYGRYMCLFVKSFYYCKTIRHSDRCIPYQGTSAMASYMLG